MRGTRKTSGNDDSTGHCAIRVLWVRGRPHPAGVPERTRFQLVKSNPMSLIPTFCLLVAPPLLAGQAALDFSGQQVLSVPSLPIATHTVELWALASGELPQDPLEGVL